jgi:hypothetical protein
MNLYKIIFSHHAPKDSKYGIETYLLAESDEQVYEWLKSEPETSEGRIYVSWSDYEDDDENFKERIINQQGQIDDEHNDYGDAYYGLTFYGWELVQEDVTNDFTDLINWNIITKIK